jgi:outer membrane protein assembly factor BamB
MTLLSRLTLLIAVVVSTAASAADPLDWTYWRGPRFDGTSPEKNIPDNWDPEGGEGSNLLWKAPYGSRSTPIVMNGKLYLITADKPDVPKEEREKVVCLDAATGEFKWEAAFNVFLTDVPRERLGWSSVVGDPETGNIFYFSVGATFACLNGETGAVIWDKSLFEEYGFLTTYGGRTNFPMVHENNVIISAVVIGWGEQAKPNHRFLAFDKRNGQPVWFEGTRPLPEDTTYSAPVLAVVNGELQMVVGAGDGALYSFQPRTGKKLWQYDVSSHGINVSPLVVGNKVYCGHSEENQDSNESGAVYCLDATKTGNITKTGELWRTTELLVGRASPLLHGDRLYVATDTGKLFVLNPNDGQLIDKRPKQLGTMVRASPLFVDGKLFMNDVSRGAYIFKPSEKGVDQLARVKLPTGEECHGSPICSHGRVYLPTTGAMYCIGNKDWKPTDVDTLPELPKETPKSADDKPAIVQVTPVEVLLKPKSKQPYQVRLYNARGQYLRLAKADEVEFSIKGPGKITKAGEYEIPADFKGQGGVIVTAKMGELSGTARIRVVPELPWSWNFDDGEVPITWVGAQYRHVVIDWDLFEKLRKEDQQAAKMYLYLYTSLQNLGTPKMAIDDTTPMQKWTEFLRYLGLENAENRPRTKEDAEKMLGPSIRKLVDEQVFASAEWGSWDRPTGEEGKSVAEPRLTLGKGSRGIKGNGVMCKLMTIPKGARSQGTMGPTDLHDYTIQADVLGLSRNTKLGDVGLIAQRYACVLMGEHQQLQIRTWHPQLERFSADYPFAWEADTWYTMKFSASTEGQKATLRAKIWKRGEQEPSNWMVEATDEVANRIGSPGLFGDAKLAEFFYDNLSVTPN